MEIFAKPDTWLALLTLSFLEIILGIDNVVFISILCNKIPEKQRKKIRTMGLLTAMGVRILLLFAITWIIGFTAPLFTISKNIVLGKEVVISSRDLILGLGGLFLIAKSTLEISNKIEKYEDTSRDKNNDKGQTSITLIIIQIVLLDIIFSFDSILTAVGMVDHISIMIIAIMLSIGVMIFFSKYIGKQIHANPSIEILALGFLILIGFTLLLEALHKAIPKGYIYFAITFSLLFELINIRIRKQRSAKRALKIREV